MSSEKAVMQMQDKAILRKEILARRDLIPPAVKKIKDKSVEDRLFGLDAIKNARTLFLFASFRSEVDTFGMIDRAVKEGKRVALPRVEGKNLGLYAIKNLEELEPGFMQILEPALLGDERKVSINEVDAIIVPGAAFDPSGNRIGYGGGFYDRLLDALERPVPVIAPTYDEQVVDSVPTDPHDKKVDIIVTDRREIHCGK